MIEMYQFNSFYCLYILLVYRSNKYNTLFKNVVYLAKIIHLTQRKIFLCHRNGGIQRRLLYNRKLSSCQDIFQFSHGFPVLGTHMAG